MSITPNQVKEAFRIQGANPEDISYVRYSNTTLQKVPLIISNSSTVFGIQFYPTGSNEGILFLKEDNTLVDKNSPITLQNLSGSNVSSIKLLVSIDSSTFDALPISSRTYDVSFNLVAITSSIQTDTDNGSGDTSGDGSTGNRNTGGGRTVDDETGNTNTSGQGDTSGRGVTVDGGRINAI